MNISELVPNEGKQQIIDTSFGSYLRFPVKTHIVSAGDSLFEMMDKYIKPYLKADDMVFISEKIVAISQGRAFKIDDIKPSKLAMFLYKFVYKSPYGIGLGSPWTMELAIRDIGAPKILFAAFCSAVTKIFGIRGVFYKILGNKARAIDGPGEYVIPPYNQYAKLAPDRPDEVANELQEHLGGNKVVIMDANDLGREVLGISDQSIDIEFCKEVFKDNPLGQGSEQTPLAIVRKASLDNDEAKDVEKEKEEEAEKEEVVGVEVEAEVEEEEEEAEVEVEDDDE